MVLFAVFIGALAATFVAEKAAPRLGLLAYPDEHRRHRQPTPIVGGIAIFFSLVAAHFFFDLGLGPMLPAITLIFLVGAADDRFKLPSGVRFIAQAVTIWLLVRSTGVELTTLGELHPGHTVSLTSWALPMTIFAGIGVINAVNMSDGMDGLLGCLVCLILLTIYTLTPSADPWVMALIVAVCAFLLFNLRVNRIQARVFLGDAGSTLLGLLVFYLLVKHSQDDARTFVPVTALWLMALPLIDAVAVLVIRPIRGSSPFAADRIHYHHLLQKRGLSVSQTLCVVIIIQTLAILLGVWMQFAQVADYLQLWFFLAIFLSYMGYLWKVTR